VVIIAEDNLVAIVPDTPDIRFIPGVFARIRRRSMFRRMVIALLHLQL